MLLWITSIQLVRIQYGHILSQKPQVENLEIFLLDSFNINYINLL